MYRLVIADVGLDTELSGPILIVHESGGGINKHTHTHTHTTHAHQHSIRPIGRQRNSYIFRAFNVSHFNASSFTDARVAYWLSLSTVV